MRGTMATGRLKQFEEFVEEVKRIGDPERYELWVTDYEIALIPIKTSKNLHTYFCKYKTQGQLETIVGRPSKLPDDPGITPLFKGPIKHMEVILLDKW